MKSYQFIQQLCPDRNSIQPGKLIGSGFHGEVFEVENQTDRVVKFSKVSEDMCASRGTLEQFQENLHRVLAYQLRHDYACFVRVFSFNFLYSGEISWHPAANRLGMQKFILYSTVMEKLVPMSEDENKLFSTLCPMINENVSGTEWLVKQQADWLDFDFKKVMTFLNQIKHSPIEQQDFQRFNVMKDVSGNFKVIDFDFTKLIRENSHEDCRFERIKQAS